MSHLHIHTLYSHTYPPPLPGHTFHALQPRSPSHARTIATPAPPRADRNATPWRLPGPGSAAAATRTGLFLRTGQTRSGLQVLARIPEWGGLEALQLRLWVLEILATSMKGAESPGLLGTVSGLGVRRRSCQAQRAEAPVAVVDSGRGHRVRGARRRKEPEDGLRSGRNLQDRPRWEISDFS
uniref:Uncharacterized protein n=1 Tax=Rangifer tarandus platyrhynchus TaxID=3082113 RepID=A0ACB0EC04_RANTA|nr:unnamed protein product [Rangifer tarandus platyrhynchus]